LLFGSFSAFIIFIANELLDVIVTILGFAKTLKTAFLTSGLV
jgi:hypothetical protein